MTIHFPMVMNYLFEEHPHHWGFMFFGFKFIITIVLAFLMFVLNYFILKPVNKHNKLKASEISLAVLLTILSVFILNHIFYSIRFGQLNLRHGIRWNEVFYVNFFVSALVIGCVLIIRLIFRQQTIKVENETLKREALQSQFESLKNQLSPHFLFNSLTALKILINEAPDKAQRYVNNLSKALRYTLQSNEKQLVTLEDEIKFIDSYLYLIRIRFDTNLIVKMNVSKDLFQYKIPPLTIQTLIENAIKHNEISKAHPLSIHIASTENYSLVISNEIQKKFNEEEGTGIGLTNLLKQFEILLGPDIFTISISENRFIVEVPLLKPNKE